MRFLALLLLFSNLSLAEYVFRQGTGGFTIGKPIMGGTPWANIYEDGSGNAAVAFQLFNNAGFVTVDEQVEQLLNNGQIEVDWSAKMLEVDGFGGIDWGNRLQYNAGNAVVFDYSETGYNNNAAISFGADINSNPAVFFNREIADNSNFFLPSIDTNAHETFDNSDNPSIFYGSARSLVDGGGITALNWSTRQSGTGVTTTGYTQNASANGVFAESTFQGSSAAGNAYTISDIVTALKNYQLLAP